MKFSLNYGIIFDKKFFNISFLSLGVYSEMSMTPFYIIFVILISMLQTNLKG